MVIIWGSRDYGRVEGHGGEYAVTRFAHLYFLPLFPTGSRWVRGKTADGTIGHPCSLVGASVAAGYLRVWGLLVGVPALVRGLFELSPALLGVGLVALALSAWSWTWRALHTARAQRRSDLNLVAFGTRCEPRRMSRELRAELRRSLDKRWDALAPGRSPNEVAEQGAHDGREAALAYGLLRLASLDRKHRGGTEATDADRILDDVRAPAAPAAGPYRDASEAPAPAGPSLSQLVGQAQSAHAAMSSPAQAAAVARRTLRHARLALVLAILSGLSAAVLIVDGAKPTLAPDLATLRSIEAPIDRDVRVTCDAPPSWLGDQVDERGRVTDRFAMCLLADHVLVVRVDADAALPGRVVEGKLHSVDHSQPWARELAKDPDLNPRALGVWVEQQSALERAFPLLFGIGLALLAVAAAFLSVRWRRRAKAATA